MVGVIQRPGERLPLVQPTTIHIRIPHIPSFLRKVFKGFNGVCPHIIYYLFRHFLVSLVFIYLYIMFICGLDIIREYRHAIYGPGRKWAVAKK